MTEDLNKVKVLSFKQACSKWVNKFADDFLKGNDYSLRDLRWTTYDYIRLVNAFPNEKIEDTVVDMFKTNYTVLSYFNGDKDKVKEDVEALFRNNGCLNEFVDDFTLFIKDVVEPLGKSKNEIFINQTRERLSNYDKIDKIYNTGILEWNFVKSNFPSNMEFWKVKEAISWMVGFVENCDYELTDVVVLNDYHKIDKKKSFDKLLTKINESSLTQQNPFTKSNGKLYFNDAKGGEVDVMLWNEKKNKIVSMSATRDRGFKIEGNQFPRHYIKSLVLYDNIMEYHNSNKIPLTSNNVQRLVRNKSFQTFNGFEKAFKTESHPDVKFEVLNLNAFAKDLNFIRNKLKKLLDIDFHTNGLNIKDTELSSILAYGDSKVEFVFFGELLENKHMGAVQAGLNCLAYRDNFKRVGKFRMTDNASNIFMRSISKRFNGISPSEQNIESYGQNFIIELMKFSQDVEKNITNIQYFSEGNVYEEERSCLFKACSILFRNVINELDIMDNNIRNNFIEIKESESSLDITNLSIEKGIRFFFDKGIDNSDVQTLLEFFSSKDKMNSFILNFDSIKTSISEVPLELEDLEFCKDRLVASFNNINDRVEIAKLTNSKNIIKNQNDKLEVTYEENVVKTKVKKTRIR